MQASLVTCILQYNATVPNNLKRISSYCPTHIYITHVSRQEDIFLFEILSKFAENSELRRCQEIETQFEADSKCFRGEKEISSLYFSPPCLFK